MKPSCCFSLGFVIKYIAFLDFIVAAVSVVLTSGGLIYVNLFHDEVNEWLQNPEAEGFTYPWRKFVDLHKLWTEDGGQTATVLLVVGLLIALQILILSCVLVIAIFQERLKLLRIWIVYTLILLVVCVFIFLGLLITGISEPLCIPLFVLYFLSREYAIWIAYSHLKKLKGSLSDFLIPSSSTFTDSGKVVCKL